MRLVKVAVLSLSCLALGCGLFPSSSNQNPGSNAPVTYPPRSRSDGGPDATITGGPDLGKTPTDAGIHNGAQRWIPIQTSYPVTKCTWFSTSNGF